MINNIVECRILINKINRLATALRRACSQAMLQFVIFHKFSIIVKGQLWETDRAWIRQMDAIRVFLPGPIFFKRNSRSQDAYDTQLRNYVRILRRGPWTALDSFGKKPFREISSSRSFPQRPANVFEKRAAGDPFQARS